MVQLHASIKTVKLKETSTMVPSANSQFKTIKIGNQTCSAENISIPIKGNVCYETNPQNCKTFGPLYTYAQA